MREIVLWQWEGLPDTQAQQPGKKRKYWKGGSFGTKQNRAKIINVSKTDGKKERIYVHREQRTRTDREIEKRENEESGEFKFQKPAVVITEVQVRNGVRYCAIMRI
jgi:hypothetical protein